MKITETKHTETRRVHCLYEMENIIQALWLHSAKPKSDCLSRSSSILAFTLARNTKGTHLKFSAKRGGGAVIFERCERLELSAVVLLYQTGKVRVD